MIEPRISAGLTLVNLYSNGHRYTAFVADLAIEPDQQYCACVLGSTSSACKSRGVAC